MFRPPLRRRWRLFGSALVVPGMLGGLLSACTVSNPDFEGKSRVSVADGSAGRDSLPESGFTPDPDRTPVDAGGLEADADVLGPTSDDGSAYLPIEDALADADEFPPAEPDASPADDVATETGSTPDVRVDPLPEAGPVDAPVVDLVSGLIGYWRFDEAFMATVVKDSSGKGHHGQIEGTTTSGRTEFAAGHFGRALEITESNATFGIRVEPTPLIKKIKDYTLAAWVFRYGPRDVHCSIISRQLNATDAEVFNLAVARDVPKAYAPDRTPAGVVTQAASSTTAPVNVWFHLAATFDGKTLSLYQDGKLLQAVPYSQPLPPTDTPLYLATNKNVVDNQTFYGVLDELLLYDVALPVASIAALAHDQRPAVP